MKPTLTPELKERFFALYWGQDIVCWPGVLDQKIAPAIFMGGGVDWQDHLLLRPLASIKDNEAIEVAKIVCARHNRHYLDKEISYEIQDSPRKPLDVILKVKGHNRYIIEITHDGIGFVDFRLGGAGKEHFYCPGQYEATDYLRSISIALPYFGHSVEELCAAGWVKLIENIKEQEDGNKT